MSKPKKERASAETLEALSDAELKIVTGGDTASTVIIIITDMGQPRGGGGPGAPGPGG